MTVKANIFTNAHSYAPDTALVDTTHKSFVDVFGKIPTTVWVDAHPRTEVAQEYVTRLRKNFADVRITNSLSDGYIQSITGGVTDYCVQLEGDWIFLKENIAHSLEDMINTMSQDGLYHFRFNKRKNVVAGWDKTMVEHTDNIPYCISNNISNNPHIIDRRRYADDIVRHINLTGGSKGIEEVLIKTGLYESALYGRHGHPSTIMHLDGRGNRSTLKTVTKRPTIYKRLIKCT